MLSLSEMSARRSVIERAESHLNRVAMPRGILIWCLCCLQFLAYLQLGIDSWAICVFLIVFWLVIFAE